MQDCNCAAHHRDPLSLYELFATSHVAPPRAQELQYSLDVEAHCPNMVPPLHRRDIDGSILPRRQYPDARFVIGADMRRRHATDALTRAGVTGVSKRGT